MTEDKLKTESEAATGREASAVKRLVMCDFAKDHEFRRFVEKLPDKTWVKYDLSAVRFGWEARKIFCSEITKTNDVVVNEDHY